MSEQLTQRIAEVLRQEIMVKRSGVFINKADPEAVAEAVVAALQLREKRDRSAMCPADRDYDRVRWKSPWVEVQP